MIFYERTPINFPKVQVPFFLIFIRAVSGFMASTSVCLAGLKRAPQAWKPYRFSRRRGVENDPGHQGYHGMKMKMNPEVIRLGRMVQNATSTGREAEKEGNKYYMFTTVKAPYSGTYKIETGKENHPDVSSTGKKDEHIFMQQ